MCVHLHTCTYEAPPLLLLYVCKIYTYTVHIKHDSEHELEKVREKILKLAKDLSLECEVEDVEELLDQESGELTNEELIEVEEERVAGEDEEEPERKFTTKEVSEGLS